MFVKRMRDFCYIGNAVQINLIAATTENKNSTNQVYYEPGLKIGEGLKHPMHWYINNLSIQVLWQSRTCRLMGQHER